MNASLISIRPRFVDAIFSGEKWVELRRRRFQAEPGQLLFVYETSPVMAIRGIVRVRSVETGSVTDLWPRVAAGACVTRTEYQSYFSGSQCASAIHVTEPQAFAAPLTLSAIRATSPLFHPPRTWTAFAALPLPLQVCLRAYFEDLVAGRPPHAQLCAARRASTRRGR
jgi:predicted transcriptional regulator